MVRPPAGIVERVLFVERARTIQTVVYRQGLESLTMAPYYGIHGFKLWPGTNAASGRWGSDWVESS